MTEVIGGILGAFGLSVSAGLNAYIPLLVVSLLAKFTDLIELAKPWDALESWWTIGVLGVLVIIEAIADKVPVVDHVNDAIQTFIRPTAGAILFAASAKSITEIHPVLSLICGCWWPARYMLPNQWLPDRWWMWPQRAWARRWLAHSKIFLPLLSRYYPFWFRF